MISRPTDSRKNSLSNAQRLANISSLVDAYSVSADVVQCSLSAICKALNKKKTLSSELSVSLINALKEMNKPLSFLRSAFEELANLPDTLIPFHLVVFIALCDVQSQAVQVEACMKICYKHILASALQELADQQTEMLLLVTAFRAQLSKVNRLLKKVFGPRTDLSQEGPATVPDVEKGSIQVDVPHLKMLPDPSHEERAVMAHQGVSENAPSEILSRYRSILKGREEQLVEIEERKVKYIDLRALPPDLEKNEASLRSEIQRLRSEIAIQEQIGKNESS